MGPDDDGRRDDAEILDAGRDRHGVWPPRRLPRWLPVLLAAVVAAVGITVASRENGGPSAPPAGRPPPTSHSAPGASAGSASAGSAAPPVAVTTVARPLLPATGGWELFGRAAGEVVRIEVALGRITRTIVPGLRSTGPVSFVAGADRAIIRPLDHVAGYVVPDGRPAREMPPALSQGGPMFPGPDPRHVWVQSGDDAHPGMVLRALDGGADRASIPVPAGSGPLDATSDGGGYLLYTGTGGVYHARPGSGLRRITTGSMLAVGPKSWLTVECDDQHRCHTVVIDRPSGSRRVLGAALDTNGPRGTISPDGKTAAMVKVGPEGTSTLHLLDLVSGTTRRVDAPIDEFVTDGTVVWSPDSRWLCAVGAGGVLRVVDPATAQATDLGVPLPELRQLAVRTTGPAPGTPPGR